MYKDGDNMNDLLVKKAKKGNDEAFYELISRNKEKLYRIAYRYFGNECDSLEAIQEITYRAYVNIHKIKNNNYFDTWITRILINYCNDEIKRKKRVTNIYKEVSGSNSMDTDKIDIDNALKQLNENYKTTIILKYFEDYTIRDISETMNKPEGTIKTWLNRGLKNLKVILNKDGEYIV